MTLRLRCIRCGELAEMDPTTLVFEMRFGLCPACFLRWDEWRARGWSYRRRWNLWNRHRRGMERHPTYKALTAALSSLESVPHGTLAEP